MAGTGPMAEGLAPLRARMPRAAIEREVLRVAADLAAADPAAFAEARRQALAWAEARAGGRLPPAAWEGAAFEHLAGGRVTLAERAEIEGVELWALRADDPDKTVAQRVWTVEVALARTEARARLGLRLMVNSPEEELDILPAVPGLVLQMAAAPGLRTDGRALAAEPWRIDGAAATEALIALLEDPGRRLPVIVASGDQRSGDPDAPLIDAAELAKAAAGLAHVAVLPAAETFRLTEAFGKLRSVYFGAVRLYWPGFGPAADPYAHPLILDGRLREDPAAVAAELRRAVARESLRRLRLDADLPRFETLRAAARREAALALAQGAGEEERRAALEDRLEALEAALALAEAEREEALALAAEEEERARAAEAQLAGLAARLEALEDRLRARGQDPDADLPLPASWAEFADWCDEHLAGRVVLAPAARRMVKDAAFVDVALAARCLLWLAGPCLRARIAGGQPLDGARVEPGLHNARCGGDTFSFDFRGARLVADWHVKTGGNTRAPERCLRIYYGFDPARRQIVVAEMPAHRRTGAS